MIKAIGLTKRFGAVIACDGVSFECYPGEILGLLGPNGAGKTTTLRMLSTALRPSDGTAIIAGYDLVANPEMIRRNIGILPTEPGLYGRLTAAENLRYFGRLYDMPEDVISRRIDETLEMLGLLGDRDRRTEQFSRGMKQKVAIARAILHDPPAILFDEPTAGLDVMSARSVHDFIVQCKKAGKALILSTHSMNEAERLCDRVAIIVKGKIRAIGTAHELKSMVSSSDLEEAFMKLAEGAGGIL